MTVDVEAMRAANDQAIIELRAQLERWEKQGLTDESRVNGYGWQVVCAFIAGAGLTAAGAMFMRYVALACH